MYVTEYQANFKPYPPECYGGQPRTEARKPSPVSSGQIFRQTADSTTQTRTVTQKDRWQKLLSTVNKLIEKDYEGNTMRDVREHIQARRLDPELEFAYQHCKDVLQSTQADHHEPPQRTTNGRTQNGAAANGHHRACVTHLPEETRKLCEEFIRAVDDLKRE
jgi:hypothetical protein